jgi:hypothetical protein
MGWDGLTGALIMRGDLVQGRRVVRREGMMVIDGVDDIDDGVDDGIDELTMGSMDSLMGSMELTSQSGDLVRMNRKNFLVSFGCLIAVELVQL